MKSNTIRDKATGQFQGSLGRAKKTVPTPSAYNALIPGPVTSDSSSDTERLYQDLLNAQEQKRKTEENLQQLQNAVGPLITLLERQESHGNGLDQYLVTDALEAYRTALETTPNNAELLCGDWPAPCNCDDPTTHNGHNKRL